MIKKMAAISDHAEWYESYEELEPFTKIRRHQRDRMPVATCGPSNRAVHKTAGSRKVSRHISRTRGGKHCRRLNRSVPIIP